MDELITNFLTYIIGSDTALILLANLGESDKIAKLQVHGEYSRMGEPTWIKQEPGKRHDCWEKLHHTVDIAAFSVIEIQRRSFIAILTQPRRIRQQYQLWGLAHLLFSQRREMGMERVRAGSFSLKND